jgi:transposase
MERKPYKTDLSDQQWACLQSQGTNTRGVLLSGRFVSPLIPPGKAQNGGRGRQRRADMREILNAIFFWADNGC